MPGIYIEAYTRKVATVVTLPDGAGGWVDYTFTPNPDGKCVARIDDDAHQRTLLAIAEGYRFYSPVIDVPLPSTATMDLTPPTIPGAVGEAGPVQPALEPQPAPAAADLTNTSAGGAPAEATGAFDPLAAKDLLALIAWAEESPENEAALRKMHAAELGSEPRANARVDTIAGKIVAKRSLT